MPGAIGSSSLESCCCGRSYFAIKLEHISAARSGIFLWQEKLVARFTRCLASGLMCGGTAAWRNVCRWRTRGKAFSVSVRHGRLCNPPFCRASTASLRSSIRERSENRVTEGMKRNRGEEEEIAGRGVSAAMKAGHRTALEIRAAFGA